MMHAAMHTRRNIILIKYFLLFGFNDNNIKLLIPDKGSSFTGVSAVLKVDWSME